MIIALCCLLSALTLYVQALKNAMGAKRWGCLGLAFGPLIVPMFISHKRLLVLKAAGRDHIYWQPR